MGNRKKPFLSIALMGFFLLVMLSIPAGFLMKTWLPPVASKHGVGIDYVIHFLLWTTGAVFVVGHLVLMWLVWQNTGKGKSTYKPVSQKVEFIWALVPVIFMGVISEAGVLVIGRPVWQQLYGETDADALKIELIGRQFEWFVRYPGKDGVFGKTSPEAVIKRTVDGDNFVGLDKSDPAALDDIVLRSALRLPVGRMVSIRLRTQDVQHSFSVPAFRVKQDLVPGLTTRTQFTPTLVGEYEIACSELCGLGHYKMRGMAIVLTEQNFDDWLAKQKSFFND